MQYMGTCPYPSWARNMTDCRRLVLLLIGFGTPIFLTLLGHIRWIGGFIDRLNPYLIYPSTIGKYQVQPLPYLVGNAPTVGQALYIGLSVVLHVLLCALNIDSVQPHGWLGYTHTEMMSKLAGRSGVLAVALAPLVILFAGRNNILLWATNWSRSTFILLHRWTARLFALHVVLHAVLELAKEILDGTYFEESKKDYWIWGIVSVLCTSLMLFLSLLYARKRSYEVFLVTHIVLAVFVLVGAWYHITMGPHRKPGVEYWLYATFAVWGLDRVLRLWRIAKVGFRRARIDDLGDGYVRVDVPGVRWPAMPGHHAYIHFPTLNVLKPWENHPFSIVPTSMLRPITQSSSDDEFEAESPSTIPNKKDIEKGGSPIETGGNRASRVPSQTGLVPDSRTIEGVTFYIRKSTGLTKNLSPIKHSSPSLLALLDGPYPSNSTAGVLASDRLLLLAGGIGITAVLPFLASAHPNMKLHWTLRATAKNVLADVEPGLHQVQEKDIRVGERMNVAEILRQEARDGWKRVAVVVCGPAGLCDDVRVTVIDVSKEMSGKCVFDMEVDAFSW